MSPRYRHPLHAISQPLLYSLGRAFVSLYARLMLKLDIFWCAPLPPGPKLIVANHPSACDPFLLSLLSPEPLKLLIIDNPFTLPVFGDYLRWSGHVPVVPDEGLLAFEEALRRLEDGHPVALFPEGWISPREGGFNSPHTGAARLALLTGVPIVPVGIYLPRERNHVIRTRMNGKTTVGYWYLSGPYAMTVGRPLRFEGDVEDRARVVALTRMLMERIIALAHQSERRVVAVSEQQGLRLRGLRGRKPAYTSVRVDPTIG